MIVDKNRDIVAVNQTLCEMIGYSEQELVGQSAEIMHVSEEQYLEFGKKAFEKVRRNEPVNLEWFYRRRDGTEFWARIAGDPVAGEEEVLWTLVDITKRIKAESRLEDLASQLSKYLSPQIYKSIFSGETSARPQTRRKKLSVFFSDIEGFTELTDRLEPEVLSTLLNSYLDEMAQIALKHGGTIDKFVGDAIMVFFGDPQSQGEKQDALACVRMALEMRRRMVQLRREWQDIGITSPLKIRIGINTGHCNVGNFGSENRLDYTIVGGQVNLASRLESSADADQILISEETHVLVRDEIACEKMASISVKGIPYPVQTYQAVDEHQNMPGNTNRITENFDGFDLTIDLGEADRKKVVESLENALKDLQNDPG